jgi:hypothetical protein
VSFQAAEGFLGCLALCKDAGGAGGTDAVQAEQTGPGLVEQFPQLNIDGFDLVIERGELVTS